MATGDGTNLSAGGTPAAAGLVKEDARGTAVAVPPHHSSLDRHWIPDERDAFILWLRGEFAAANAIIDTLCRHLQLIGQPGEYDYALTCIQQRRYNWTVVLHMQQYFSVAEVVIALQQVLWRKQQQQGHSPDHGSVHLHPGSVHADHQPAQVQHPLVAISDPLSQPADHASAAPLKDTKASGGDPDSIQHSADKRSSRDPGREPAADPSSASQHLNSSQQDKAKDAYQNPMPGTDSHEAGVGRQQIEANAAATPSPHHRLVDGSKEQGKRLDFSKASPASSQEASQDPPPQNRPVPSPIPLQRAKSLDANHTFYEQLGPPQLSNKQSGNFVGAEFQFSSSDEEDRRLALVKSSKDFNCIEMIEGKPINVVGGLELYENVFDESETSRLAALVNELLVSGKRRESGKAYGTKRWQKDKGRETLQFSLPRSDALDEDDKPLPSLVKEQLAAYYFDMSKHDLSSFHLSLGASSTCKDEGGRSFASVNSSFTYCADDTAESVPGFFLAVAERLVRWQILPASKRPDFCSINVSEEGDYIRPHGDHHHWERPFCTLSLSTECSMVFGRFLKMDRPGEFSGPFKISLPPGSALVFQGNSADVARCAIPTLPARRISLTFGKKLPSKNTKANQAVGALHLTPPPSWTSSPNRQGMGGTSGSSGGSPNRGAFGPLKNHNIAPTTSGVLPVPSIRPSGAVPQLSPGIQPLLSTTAPHTNSFSSLQGLSPAWSTVARPTRPPSAGTGVFFPTSGSSTGPGRPASGSAQRRQGVLAVAPTLHKTSSSPASFCSLDGSSPSIPSPSSSRPEKSQGSATADNPEQGASTTRAEETGKWKAGGCRETPAEGGVKSEANGTRASKEEPASTACGLSKAASSNRLPYHNRSKQRRLSSLMRECIRDMKIQVTTT